MSTSLNVVSRAFVFWEAFKFSAIFILILVIGTLVSNLDPPICVGAVFEVVVAVPPEEADTGAFYGVTGAGVLLGAGFGGAGAALGAACADSGAAFGGAAAFAEADPALASVSRM